MLLATCAWREEEEESSPLRRHLRSESIDIMAAAWRKNGEKA